jgi:hypothetical protein
MLIPDIDIILAFSRAHFIAKFCTFKLSPVFIFLLAVTLGL